LRVETGEEKVREKARERKQLRRLRRKSGEGHGEKKEGEPALTTYLLRLYNRLGGGRRESLSRGERGFF